MLFPWVVIGSCIAITTGIQAAFGFAFTAMTTALAPTLMIIGMGVSVHVMNEFYNLRSKDSSGRDAALKTKGIVSCNVEVTFDPPWDATCMSEAARLEAGLL